MRGRRDRSGSDGALRASTAGGTTPAIKVRGLTKRFGSGEAAVVAVDDVNFDVESGTVVGILGPNGAGKTTTIKSMLGLVLPDEGTVEISGADVHRDPTAAYRQVGAMLEGARNVYWRLTVMENLEFFASLGGTDPDSLDERHRELLDQLGLAGKAAETVNELSRGQKQKVALASTLARGTDVVFLDEPTLGLDVESSLELRRELRRLVEDRDMTVVLSSHDMDVVEAVCDRVIIMSDGEIIADDSVDELVSVFRTHAYRVAVEGLLPADARETLTVEFGATTWNETDERTTFELTLETGRAIYRVMDVLEAAAASVEDISGVEPDLEEVFLELTDADRAARSQRAAAPLDGEDIDESAPGGGVPSR